MAEKLATFFQFFDILLLHEYYRGFQNMSYTIAIAGHVDHGKTSLVRVLTGVNTDRLPEEVRRGLTIDLAFAHGKFSSKSRNVDISFIDENYTLLY